MNFSGLCTDIAVVFRTMCVWPRIYTTLTIEQWSNQSQEILTGAIPALLRECEALRRRAEAAEERSQWLSRENEGLQEEITRFRGDLGALTRQRAEMADAVAEIQRLTNATLLTLSAP
jgi:predicted  nucleic acid-binding Zn-ribbon protein